ncbi:MAG: hypothetical protein ACFB00_00255 [Parvularculaceae bacterium]
MQKHSADLDRLNASELGKAIAARFSVPVRRIDAFETTDIDDDEYVEINVYFGLSKEPLPLNFFYKVMGFAGDWLSRLDLDAPTVVIPHLHDKQKVIERA